MIQKILTSAIWSVLALGALLALAVVNPSFIESVKLRYFDTLITSTPVVENNIYTVNIDEESINLYGQWPWPRDVYANIIEELYARETGLVVWNILMSEPDRAGRDEDLATTLSYYPVVLNILGAEESKNEAINPGAAIINSEFQDLILQYPGIIANIPELETTASGSGIVNTLPEIDGVTRRVPLVISSGGTLYPNLTLETLRVLAGDPSFQIKLSPLGVDRLRIPQFGEIPTDELSRVWVDWSQSSQSVSLSNLPESFGGAVVFVAPTAAGLSNPIATAKGSVWPHELQASLLGTVFNQSNIERPSWAPGAELLALALGGIALIAAARWTYVGMAQVQFLEAGDRSSVPPGYFWCEYFDGPHYSATYQFCHDTLPYWKPLSCWQGTNSALNLTKFTRWIRIPDYAPQVPRQLNVLSDVHYINIEFKGDKPIEVHLRPSGNPDGSIHSDYNEYMPVWESGEHDAITMFQKGYSFISNQVDMSDVDTHTAERRLGFFVR